jgi:hypothetical protein
MVKKDKKQKHAKKRQEARKRQKAKVQSQPKLLRKDPVFKVALNHRHPLVACFINEAWEEYQLANVFVIRETPFGLVLANFLVDIAGVGLKDAWGDYGFSEADIENIKVENTASGNALIPCDLSLINDLVYGGIFWAKKWKFRLPKNYAIWLRLLEPVDQKDVKLDLFGENGKPMLFLDEDDIDRVIKKELDPQILKDNLAVDKDGLPPATLDRIGDIKSALIDFSHRSEFMEDFETAANVRFGEKKPKSDFEWVNFQDWFVLQYELNNRKTVAQRFTEHYKNYLSNDVHRLLKDWNQVIEGLFEVNGCDNGKTYMKNLINEREYSVYTTASWEKAELNSGDFVFARIVPAMGFHIFSGALSIIQSDGSQRQRAGIYKTAVDIQMQYPAKAFQDNAKKLQKSRQAVRNQYDDFMTFFGTDEVLGNGNEILQQYQAFFDYQAFEKVNPDTGLTPAAFYEQDTGKAYKPPIVQLPEEVLENEDVAMLCDSEEGLSFLIQYRQFLDIFKDPDMHLGRFEAEDLVLGYLETESISDIPFKKVAKRFPGNFKKVMEYLGGQKGFGAVEIDDLMREFKPHSFNKLPTTVTILDSEMTYLARLADEKSNSEIRRFKRLLQNIKKKT